MFTLPPSQGGQCPENQGTQVPRALRYPRHPRRRIDRVRTGWTAGRTGAEGPEMRQRDHTAYVEGGPPQRPARLLVLAADAIRPLGMASILLPSAAEGSCPVELGNPPILALILMRHKGCTVLRLRYQ